MRCSSSTSVGGDSDPEQLVAIAWWCAVIVRGGCLAARHKVTITNNVVTEAGDRPFKLVTGALVSGNSTPMGRRSLAIAQEVPRCWSLRPRRGAFVFQ